MWKKCLSGKPPLPLGPKNSVVLSHTWQRCPSRKPPLSIVQNIYLSMSMPCKANANNQKYTKYEKTPTNLPWLPVDEKQRKHGAK
jgi:hypothetical protein